MDAKDAAERTHYIQHWKGPARFGRADPMGIELAPVACPTRELRWAPEGDEARRGESRK